MKAKAGLKTKNKLDKPLDKMRREKENKRQSKWRKRHSYRNRKDFSFLIKENAIVKHSINYEI